MQHDYGRLFANFEMAVTILTLTTQRSWLPKGYGLMEME
jgi:hypothetical protein